MPPSYYRVSELYNFRTIDLLRGEGCSGEASHEQNLKDIPKQEEFSSVLQQCEALVGIQIVWFGHWESLMEIQGFDSG